jgi:hypothetical protein
LHLTPKTIEIRKEERERGNDFSVTITHCSAEQQNIRILISYRKVKRIIMQVL